MKRNSKAHQLELERVRDLGVVLSTEEGRRFLYRQLVASRIFSTCFAADPYVNAFSMGLQDQGKRLLADLQAAYPDAYLTMMKEAKIKEEIDGRSSRSSSSTGGDE